MFLVNASGVPCLAYPAKSLKKQHFLDPGLAAGKTPCRFGRP